MKFSENWLRELVNPDLDTDALIAQLTMAGLEVDGSESVAADFSQVIVAEILSAEPHPDAQKLQICQVNHGSDENITIVCGAPNARAGLRAPLAVVGAKLPGFKIKPAKLRGVKSFGMLCSAQELGLAESAKGLLELPEDAPIGIDLREYLQLDDLSIDVDLTPNRGDCLSLIGIAREVAALNQCDFQVAEVASVEVKHQRTVTIDVVASEACPHYVGRVITDIQAQAKTPLWMQERLRRSGLRSLSPVVDVTNYVLLEMGQPMHAFDFDQLKTGIQVRYANQAEKLTLLDGQDIELDNKTLVIADADKALAIAGVMGGADSAVSDNTQTIFLESAFFTPHLLAGCARRYGLHTDSSHRFERGVDPTLQVKAIERATALLLDIVGGQAGNIIEYCDEQYMPTQQPITLRAERINALLGIELDANVISDALSRLGMQLQQEAMGVWQVTVPSFRFDLLNEADLIEEVARLYGYDNIPNSRLPMPVQIHEAQDQHNLKKLQAILVERGYQEAITYSFVDDKIQKLLNPDVESIALANPLASDMAVMRTSLWTGLLQALSHNLKRQQPDIRLFETGLRFVQQGDELEQIAMISGVLTGRFALEQWGVQSRKLDFFDVKADIEALLSTQLKEVAFARSQHSALHPGQSADIMLNGQNIGVLGALHPFVAKKLGLHSGVYVFELQLEALLISHVPKLTALSKFPSIRRDLAVVVNQEVAAEDILSCIRQYGTDILTHLQLFDVYQGEGVGLGQKSLALGLTFQATSRNLTDEEIEPVIKQVINELAKSCGASLRD